MAELQVCVSVSGRAVTWELVEIKEPALLPLIPEGDDFDFMEFVATDPRAAIVTSIIRKRAA